VDSVLEEIRLARGSDRRFDGFTKVLERDLSEPVGEVEARLLAERLALALQASLLIRHSVPAVADVFCGTRLSDQGGRAYGTLPPSTDFRAILNRAYEA
jgi:putative acyl-CoA dehydrogenase